MCEYCHEDFEGFITPIEKNCHAFVRYGMNGWVLSLKVVVGMDNSRAIHVYEKLGFRKIKPTMYLMELQKNMKEDE